MKKTATGNKTLFLWLGLISSACWLIYSRRPRQRIISQEGIEDPQVSQAFNWIARMPQMWLLRWYAIKRALALVDRGTAVDLGCGSGLLVMEMARRAPELHVIGLDLSKEMLEQANINAQRSPITGRVAFRPGDAAQIPYPDQSIDLVVSSLSLHHWHDPVIVLNEISRVLRPSGGYMIFDLRRDMALPAYLLLWFVTNFIVPAALYHINEPLGSRHAAYTAEEAAQLASLSHLHGWRVTQGPLWLTIEGHKT